MAYEYVGAHSSGSDGITNFINCEFYGNEAVNGAGAVAVSFSYTSYYNYKSPPDGMYREDCVYHIPELNLINCVFSNNEAGSTGGAIVSVGSTTNLKNCTVAGNSTSSEAGGILLEPAFHPGECPNPPPPTEVSVSNVIAWDNTPDSFQSTYDDEWIEVEYSNVQGGFPGPGNLDEDPMFVGTGTDQDQEHPLQLQSTSPCLDQGMMIPGISSDLRNDFHFCRVLEPFAGKLPMYMIIQ